MKKIFFIILALIGLLILMYGCKHIIDTYSEEKHLRGFNPSAWFDFIASSIICNIGILLIYLSDKKKVFREKMIISPDGYALLAILFFAIGIYLGFIHKY